MKTVENTMKAAVTLLPPQSKRLIARAVKELPQVENALQEGIVVIASGSTNGYVAEEILNKEIDRKRYLTGATLPPGVTRDEAGIGQDIPDVVLRQGQLAPDLDRLSALKEMNEGDVYIKGANALNYEEQVAGVLIGGHGGAGTIGGAWGHVIGRRLHLVIPVGLEKCVAQDINEVAHAVNSGGDHYTPDTPRLMPVRGTIITEIEAFAILTGVYAYHLASGGIYGAEGAVWLLLEGDNEQVEAALDLVNELKETSG